MAADDARTSRLSRRNFLSSAALGAAYVAARPPISFASSGVSPSVAPVSTANVDAFEGVLRSFSKGTFEIETGGVVSQVVALSGSTFWKGGETSGDRFSVGDSVLVRTVNGQLDRAWANLIQASGTVVAGGSDGVRIALDDHGTNQLAVALPSTTDFRDVFTGQATRVALPPSTSVNVVGLETPSGLVASAIRYQLPGAQPQLQPTQPSVTVTQAVSASPDVLMCTFTYNHFVSFFSCPTGQGACGTCNTSNSSQCAWPAQDTCGCCAHNGCGCDCAHGCVTLAIAGCGHHVNVTDACSGKVRDTVIADCGPCMNSCGCSLNVCGHVCDLCGLSRTHPIVDLTKPTYSIFRDPSQVMCFPAKVQVTIPC